MLSQYRSVLVCNIIYKKAWPILVMGFWLMQTWCGPCSRSTDITGLFLTTWMFIDAFLATSFGKRLPGGSKFQYCIDQLKSHNYPGHI